MEEIEMVIDTALNMGVVEKGIVNKQIKKKKERKNETQRTQGLAYMLVE